MDSLDHNQIAQLSNALANEERDATLKIGQRIGRRQIVDAFRKICDVTNLLDLKTIKETKSYKGFKVLDENKKVVTITTWDEFCRLVEGRSKDTIDNDLKNLEMLGAETFDAMQQIGIGAGVMRSIRHLPDEEKEIIAEAAKAESKDQVLDLIHEIIAKHDKDIKSIKTQLENVTEDKAALEKVSTQKDAKINELEVQINRKPTPDEAILAEGQARADATGLMQKAVTEIIIATNKFNTDMNMASRMSDDLNIRELFETNVRIAYQSIAELADRLDVQIDFKEMVVPSWLSIPESDVQPE